MLVESIKVPKYKVGDVVYYFRLNKGLYKDTVIKLEPRGESFIYEFPYDFIEYEERLYRTPEEAKTAYLGTLVEIQERIKASRQENHDLDR